jgi:hypothetical protein
MNRIHRARLRPPPRQASWLGWPTPGWRPLPRSRPGGGDPFCLVPSPAGASLMKHTAAASGNPRKRGRQWLP